MGREPLPWLEPSRIWVTCRYGGDTYFTVIKSEEYSKWTQDYALYSYSTRQTFYNSVMQNQGLFEKHFSDLSAWSCVRSQVSKEIDYFYLWRELCYFMYLCIVNLALFIISMQMRYSSPVSSISWNCMRMQTASSDFVVTVDLLLF